MKTNLPNPSTTSSPSRYPTPPTPQSTLEKLNSKSINLFIPTSKKELLLSSAFSSFSNFVLSSEYTPICMDILEKDEGNTVGELQGGSDEFTIYRVSILDDDDDDDEKEKKNGRKNAALQLLQLYHSTTYGKRYSSILTLSKLKSYMLSMCAKRTLLLLQQQQEEEENCRRNYNKLGNVMLILQFGGPTNGQVRHIDNMIPNVQICTYLSDGCPSTIVYDMEAVQVHVEQEEEEDEDEEEESEEGGDVTNVKMLLHHWQNTHTTTPTPPPPILHHLLSTYSHLKLSSKFYTKYFSHLRTLSSILQTFGKLYQSVSCELKFSTTVPGTTLIAGGNEVHAGPPTDGPRMFAFAIGIPDEEEEEDGDTTEEEEEEYEEEENDGEVQYSPVTLHIDVCCILFGILDYEYNTSSSSPTTEYSESDIKQAKHFLISLLIHLIQDYPTKSYLRQMDIVVVSSRVDLVSWLEQVLDLILEQQQQQQQQGDEDDGGYANNCIKQKINEAVESEIIFYSPDVVQKRKSKDFKKKNRKNRKLRDKKKKKEKKG